MHSVFRRALVVFAGPALLTALVVTCATNPVTGKSELSLVSESQEIQMGQDEAKQVVSSIGLVADPELQAYVSRIGKELAAHTERPNLPWSYQVVNEPVVNAFALPGGPVFITRGILAHFNSEAEMASVLGHESGHIAARHSVQQISRSELAQLGLGVGSILSPTVAKYGGIASAGLSVLFLKFSRDDESQADALGFRYALSDGYDVRAMEDVFNTLERISGSDGRVPTWQSTHPSPVNRIADTEARLAKVTIDLNKAKLNRDVYLRQIDGLTFGDDPRQGFFEGNAFYHPDLRFQIIFPQGWATQNLPDAVLAGSPNKDAIIQLTVGPQTPPGDAASKFLAQQGMQSSGARALTINGFSAAQGNFTAQTDNGAVEGIVTFLNYAGGSYQILAYTPSGKLSSYDAAFRRTTASFDRLTDQSKLNRQAATIRIVTLPRQMTLNEFYQAYPSTVPVEEIALINGVQKSTVLTRGMLVKQVVGGK